MTINQEELEQLADLGGAEEVLDQTQDMLDSLPELAEGETFTFACHEQVPCFNRCCAELTLPLTPYDVRRITEGMEMSTETFIKTYTDKRTFPDTGFPLLLLKMNTGPGEQCPFVTMFGCSVYENRPGACRFYPLGRATSPATGGGVTERFFYVREPHCHGFDEGTQWTARSWMENQGLAAYNASNDRYMRLMAMVKASGKPIDERMLPMIILSLYQIDKFREFLEARNVWCKLEISDERRKAIMEDKDAALDFGYDWMELVIFGQCPNLARKA